MFAKSEHRTDQYSVKRNMNKLNISKTKNTNCFFVNNRANI